MNCKTKCVIGAVLGLLAVCAAGIAIKGYSMDQNVHTKLDGILQEMRAADSGLDLAAEEEAPSGTLDVTINGYAISIDLHKPGAVYSCKTLNTEFPAEFAFESGAIEKHRMQLNGTDIQSQSIQMEVAELSPKERIALHVDDQAFYIATLPESFPELVIQGESPQKGYYYSTFKDFVIKMDQAGNVVYYRNADATNAGPFRRNEMETGVTYTYLEQAEELEHAFLTGVGYRQTKLVIMDEQYRVTEEVPFMAQTDKVPDRYPLENHDYQVIGDGHYILSTYLGKKVDNIPWEIEGSAYGANVVACIIQEVKDGGVHF